MIKQWSVGRKNMDLLQEIIEKIKKDDAENLILPNSQISIKPILAFRCYVALKSIKAVLDNDSLNEDDCWLNIKHIVDIFEELGSDCKNKIVINEIN